jgi:hypothetical protein
MRFYFNILLITLLILGVSCSRKTVFFQVLKPSVLSLPPQVKTILIVERYRPTKPGNIGAVIQSILTRDRSLVDESGVDEVLQGFIDRTIHNPRFNYIRVSQEMPGSGSGWFPDPISKDEVAKLCDTYHADALLCLEAFDSERNLKIAPQTRTRMVNGANSIYVAYVAMLQMKVNVGWRLYDGKSFELYEEFKMSRTANWQRENVSQRLVTSALPSDLECIKSLGYAAGQEYADRITPNWYQVSRKVYISGDAELKRARRYMQTGQCQEAENIYLGLQGHPKRNVAGKALYNAAVAAECAGDLSRAILLSGKAYTEFGLRSGLSYQKVIQNRFDELQQLNKQLDTAITR